MDIRLNEKVDMVRQDSELYHIPVLFSGDFVDDLVKASGKSTLEHLGSPGRAPYEMKLDSMNSVPTVTVCLFVDGHALSTNGVLSGFGLSVKKSVYEHFFHRRRGPCIPPLKREGLLPLRTTPFL